MEKKNNFMPLLINSIKEKKNWALLSTVIIFFTTLLIPYILRADAEFFVMFGIVELFILVFINCLVDNNFLHNESKMTYYISKPVTLNRQILMNIVTNAVFTVYLLALIVLSVVFQGLNYEIFEIFKMLIPWLSAIILLASLSSILSGNTLMAGAMTLFNFCLPLIIYLVMMFVFTILENAVIGFSADVLGDYLLNNVYRLDYLYFIVYSEKSIDLIYFLILAVVLIFISLLTHKFIKRRKNENTGFIVFNGFKYFVSVLACLIIPAFFMISMSYSGLVSRLIISILLAMLSYYIIIAFIEKSFRISKLSIRVFAVSMVLFAAVTGSTVAVANQFKNVVPKPEDVQMAYVGNQRWSVNEIERFLKGDYKSENSDFTEWKRNRNMVTYENINSIEYITELHKEILKDQTFNVDTDYYRMGNFVVAYWMEDGTTIIRDYRLTSNEQLTKDHVVKNEIANKLLNSTENKIQKYYYIYDEEYYRGRNLYVKLKNINDYGTIIENINLNDLRDVLQKDLDNLNINHIDDMTFTELFMNYYSRDKELINEQGYFLEIYEKLSDIDENYLDEIYLSDDFVNTIEYLK